MRTLPELKQELKSKNIRLTHQRLKILEYMVNNSGHPTADEIYRALKKEIPSLSKTTVYNTLNYLSELNLIRVLSVDDNEAHFDASTEIHGHFICQVCEEIFDFDIQETLQTKELNGFKINERIVSFKGVCPRCLSK